MNVKGTSPMGTNTLHSSVVNIIGIPKMYAVF